MAWTSSCRGLDEVECRETEHRTCMLSFAATASAARQLSILRERLLVKFGCLPRAVPEETTRPGSQVEEVCLGSPQKPLSNRLAMFGVLNADVQTDPPLSFSRQRRIRAKYDYVASRFGIQSFKGYPLPAVFVARSESRFVPRHISSSQPYVERISTARARLEQFRKGRREPVVLGTYPANTKPITATDRRTRTGGRSVSAAVYPLSRSAEGGIDKRSYPITSAMERGNCYVTQPAA